MIWYLIWNIKMANFNFLLYPRYRDTIGMDCDGNWYIPELEIVSLNWGYIPNFGDRPPKESNANTMKPTCPVTFASGTQFYVY